MIGSSLDISRREILLGAGATATTVSLGNLLLPYAAFADTPLIGDHLTGNTEILFQRFLKKLSDATKASGRAYEWGAFPSHRNDVQKFLKEREQIRKFHEWNNANPPDQISATRQDIGQDLHNAILAAPDFAKDSAEPILTGAYNALAMSKGAFINFQKQHWRHKARRAAAEANTLAEISRMSGLVGNSVAHILSLEPNPSQSTFLWVNSKILSSPPSNNSSNSTVHNIRKVHPVIVVIIIIVVVTAIDIARRFYNDMTSNDENRRNRAHKQAVNAGLKCPHCARNRGNACEDVNDSATTRKGLRERGEDLANEEIEEAISDRAMQVTSQAHGVPHDVDLPAEREAIRQRDASQLRDAVRESMGPGRQESRFANMTDAILFGSLDDFQSYISSRLEHTDKIRRSSRESASKRRTLWLSGFANGKIENPMNLPADYWN